MSHRRTLAMVLTFALALTQGCFGARPGLRSYYVLHGDPKVPREEPILPGLVRVRNLNADDVYDKFQIVVRRSPYELRYSELSVWAVKPDQMVSDIIASALAETATFSSVTRELGDTRPEYTMGGQLHAIEIYDSNDIWYAHLSLTLMLNRFSTGERLWSFTFDERKEVTDTSVSHAVRALSELLGTALEQAIGELAVVSEPKQGAAEAAPSSPIGVEKPGTPGTLETPSEQQPVYVPEPPP